MKAREMRILRGPRVFIEQLQRKLERMGYRLRIAEVEIEPPEVYRDTEDDDPRWSDILRRVVG